MVAAVTTINARRQVADLDFTPAISDDPQDHDFGNDRHNCDTCCLLSNRTNPEFQQDDACQLKLNNRHIPENR
jgi:hypothetical protein